MGTVHEQFSLLVYGFDWHEAHVGPGDCFTEGCCVGCIVFAMLSTHAVRSHKLWRHDAHCVTELLELTRPVVST